MEKFPNNPHPQEVVGGVGIEEIAAAVVAIRSAGVPKGSEVLFDWLRMILGAAVVNSGETVELNAKVY